MCRRPKFPSAQEQTTQAWFFDFVSKATHEQTRIALFSPPFWQRLVLPSFVSFLPLCSIVRRTPREDLDPRCQTSCATPHPCILDSMSLVVFRLYLAELAWGKDVVVKGSGWIAGDGDRFNICTDVPPKVWLAGWTVAVSALATKENTARRIPNFDTSRGICGALEEFDVHVLFKCPLARARFAGEQV
ncbi:hypothetical protein Cgig2_033094 [Carnegiea gigantea]|uniref:Uncharacterized protein n=1 Tax=Carnegiea gigantea TaxID=171969 RepID=A0A9Q1GYH2_9CARY|nr:hypothetical protein Cgig2_033094 [Carnegiea gigantea]